MSINVVDLVPGEQVYFEHTILPYKMAAQTAVGIVTLMPRWIDYQHNRQPHFARYLLLQRRVKNGDLVHFDSESNSYLTDPTTTQVNGMTLGLVFHTFIGGNDETPGLA